jgi:hypothetical protein
VFFWKVFAIEVGGLGDATAFTVLPVALSHVNMDDNDIYKNHAAIWICTNHTSLRFIAFHHTPMHVVLKEDCMLLWITFILSVNLIDPVWQSQSIHAPRFLLRTGLSHLLSFYEHPTSSQGAAVNRGAHCTSNQQVGQRFSNIVFSPTARGGYWFLTLTLLLSLGF